MFIRKKKGQSILEYAILLGVVVAGLLIMQTFVKRGFEGGLKKSADGMGDQFSGGNTSTYDETKMEGNQTIITEVATGADIEQFGIDSERTLDKGVYSLNSREGGTITAESKVATDAAKEELTRWNEYQDTTVDDFEAPF